MKILFIFDYYYPYVGGAEVVHQRLAEYMAQKHDVIVLTQALDYPKEEIINKVRIIRVPTLHRLTFPYQAFKKAKELVKDIDLVQASTYAAGVLAAKLRKYTKAKLVLLVHGCLGKLWHSFGYPLLLGHLYELYEKKLFKKKFDHYVAVAEHTKKKLHDRGIDSNKITVIHNGVDTNLFAQRTMNISLRQKHDISATRFLGIFYGRPNIMKGINYLLPAMLKLRDEKNLHFLFILSRKPYADYKKVIDFVEKNELQKTVTIVDTVPNSQIPDYLAMANVVMLPSLTEECCMNAIEASAMNIPIIATNIPGLVEVVFGKVIFIPSKSSEAVVEAFRQAMANQFVEVPKKDFSWQKALDQYDQVYEKLVTF